MKVEYSKRATADLYKVSADSRAFGEMVAAAVEVCIREIIAQRREHPEGRPPVIERPGVHVAALVRYPFKIFYRTLDDGVRILHSPYVPPAVGAGVTRSMNKDATRTRRKHPVPYKEFDRLLRAIRDQTRDYPQEALEEIFLYLERIEKKYGVEGLDD